MRFIPVTGTGSDHLWHLSGSPFCEFMRGEGFEPIIRPDGSSLFEWDGKLHGLWWQGTTGWREQAQRLLTVLHAVDYRDRNLLAHSHGGNVCLFLAAAGFPIRTLTTIGTPRRKDVPAEQAAKFIRYWQHVHDQKRDWIATLRRNLGQLGDWNISTERRFLIPGVINIGLQGIGHSEMLSNPAEFHRWKRDGLLEGIRQRVAA